MPFDFVSSLFDSGAVDPSTFDASSYFTDPSAGGTFTGTGFDASTGSSGGIFPDGSGGFTDINGNAVDASGNPIDYSSIYNGTATGPVAPTGGAGVYPNGSGGYTDINGNPTDASGNPLTYDSNGNLVNSSGQTVNQAQPYTPSPTDQTITPGGTDAAGNILDANGNPVLDSTGVPIKAGTAAAKALGYGTAAAGTAAAGTGGNSLLGSLGKALGFGGNTASGGSSSLSDLLLPLLGGAALGYIGSKALGTSGGGSTTIQAPNYYDQFSKIQLPNYNPGAQPIVGMNPGYQMTPTVLPTGPVAPKV
jgi:hypothetical protein